MEKPPVIAHGLSELYERIDYKGLLYSVVHESGEGSLTKGEHYQFWLENGNGRVPLTAGAVDALLLTKADPDYIKDVCGDSPSGNEVCDGYSKAIQELVSRGLAEPDPEFGYRASGLAHEAVFGYRIVRDSI